MEEGQRQQNAASNAVENASLNPCCNGRGSKTASEAANGANNEVLILVVMEEGQRHSVKVVV